MKGKSYGRKETGGAWPSIGVGGLLMPRRARAAIVAAALLVGMLFPATANAWTWFETDQDGNSCGNYLVTSRIRALSQSHGHEFRPTWSGNSILYGVYHGGWEYWVSYRQGSGWHSTVQNKFYHAGETSPAADGDRPNTYTYCST